MYTATALATFPACPTFGFTSMAQYLVKHVQMEGGYEQSDLKWEEPLHRYEGVPLGDRPQRDIEAVRTFWHAMHGTHRRFRFKDWADYKSSLHDNDITALDQPIVATTGSPGGYVLYKLYEHEGFQTYRRIYLPRGATLLVANESGVEQDGANWTIDVDTGVLTPGVGFTGTPTSWGGEFDVRCRFEGDLPVELTNHKVQSATITLLERRPGT